MAKEYSNTADAEIRSSTAKEKQRSVTSLESKHKIFPREELHNIIWIVSLKTQFQGHSSFLKVSNNPHRTLICIAILLFLLRELI